MLGVDAPCEDSGGGAVHCWAQERRHEVLQALCYEVHARRIGVETVWKQALQCTEHCDARRFCWDQSRRAWDAHVNTGACGSLTEALVAKAHPTQPQRCASIRQSSCFVTAQTLKRKADKSTPAPRGPSCSGAHAAACYPKVLRQPMLCATRQQDALKAHGKILHLKSQ